MLGGIFLRNIFYFKYIYTYYFVGYNDVGVKGIYKYIKSKQNVLASSTLIGYNKVRKQCAGIARIRSWRSNRLNECRDFGGWAHCLHFFLNIKIAYGLVA